jgi:hypothetical protein
MMRRVLIVVATMLATLPVFGAPAQAQAECDLPGTTELFAIFRAPSYQAVAAELDWTGDGNGLLRARTDIGSIGTWEGFDLVCVEAPDVYALRSRANGRFVTAELSWGWDRYGLLRARATEIGAWEKFRIPEVDAPTTIQSVANDRYVSAELESPGISHGMLRARATQVGSWELFELDY